MAEKTTEELITTLTWYDGVDKLKEILKRLQEGQNNLDASISVKDDGTIVNSSVKILNFIGDGVSISDSGEGEIEIDIDNSAIGDLEQAISNGPIATSVPTFKNGFGIGDGTGAPTTITFDATVGDNFIQFFDEILIIGCYGTSGSGIILQSNNIVSGSNTDRTVLQSIATYNASTNTPTLANTDTDSNGLFYKVTVAGTQDYGDGNITLAVGDWVGNIGGKWIKVIDNNQSGATPSDEGAFNGEITLLRGGTYYDEYDLGTSGQITFSIASSSETFGYSYITVDSDGVTEFATKPNLDAIFDEQYNVPTDRILDEGLHRLYVLKTPTGAALSIPVNEYNPDVTTPTVTSVTIEDDAKDELVVVFDEDVNITTVTGLSLDNDFSGFTITSIISGSGTDTITLQLDTEVAFGESGNFVYGGTNTIEDLSGNALVAGNTAITNNVANPLTFTLDGSLTESPSGTFTKSGSNAFTDGYAVSTTQVSGAFNYRCEVASTSNLRMVLGISTNGTNRAYNTAPAWEYGAYLIQNDLDGVRALVAGVPDTVFTPPVAPSAGQYLEVRRDGSNNVTMWYDGVQYGGSESVVGDVYLHFQIYADGNEVLNPETY